jgi:putative ABC transport system substrate-binding protein
VIVTKLDRLGRSTRELLGLVERIGDADASFKSMGRLVQQSPAAGAYRQHPGDRTMAGMLKEIESAARSLGIHIQLVPAAIPDDIADAFSAIIKESAAALIVFPSPMLFAEYPRIVSLASDNRLPAIYAAREGAAAGGLMSYGANLPDLSRQTATYVHKILKGAQPADLPVQQPTKFELVINLKAAKALGLTVPPTLLARVDEVIE